MNQLLSLLLIVPIVIWSVFQPALYANAMIVEQGVSSVIYEFQKEASLQGKYDDDIYRQMKDKLIDVYNFDPDLIEIKGTESLTYRGDRIEIVISIPKPKTTVMQAFKFSNDETYDYKKYVMSEYVE